jgi:hypothetical protein
VTYPSGLAVAVPDVRRFTPSETAVGMTADTVGVVVTVDLDNGSSSDVDASFLTVAVATGGTIAPRIFDAAQDVGSGITGSIAAGTQVSGTYAFAVPEGGLDQIEVRVTPDLQQPETTVFAGAVS